MTAGPPVADRLGIPGSTRALGIGDFRTNGVSVADEGLRSRPRGVTAGGSPHQDLDIGERAISAASPTRPVAASNRCALSRREAEGQASLATFRSRGRTLALDLLSGRKV